MQAWVRVFVAVVSVVFSGGCSGDMNWPDIKSVDAVKGSSVIEALTVHETSEDAFKADLPADVSFVIHFDETMNGATAEGKIWIEETDTKKKIEVTLESRLEQMTAKPKTSLAPGKNHTLTIEKKIEDTAGHGLVNGKVVAFYTGK